MERNENTQKEFGKYPVIEFSKRSGNYMYLFIEVYFNSNLNITNTFYFK